MEDFILTTEAVFEDGEWTDEKFVSYSSDKRKLIKASIDFKDNSYRANISEKLFCYSTGA